MVDGSEMQLARRMIQRRLPIDALLMAERLVER